MPTVPAASENSELYRDQQSSVSPSWLVNGKSRYALRTVVKLEFQTIVPPRVRAGFMLLLGTVLSLVSVRYILIDAQPYLIPIIMLIGSMTLMAGGGCHGACQREGAIRPLVQSAFCDAFSPAC